MNKLKLLIVAALMAAIILPCSVFAAEEEEPVEKPKDPEVVELVEDQEEDQANEEKPEAMKLIVKVVNVPEDFEVIKELSAVYEIKSQMAIPDTIILHKEKIVDKSDYMIAQDALGRDWIEINDCEVTIFVIPRTKDLQIVHHLFDCAAHEVGAFLEHETVDYLAEITDETAQEIAKTRIGQMNAKGYVFKAAKADIEADLPAGVKVTTLDGEDVTPDPHVPTVHLFYIEQGCVEEEEAETTEAIEEKVDAAKTPNEELQLPATGAQDLLAFFMSAVALLGIGIFFAKKH